MNNRIAIVDGIRTPICKAGGVFDPIPADDLGALVVKEIMARGGVSADTVSELIFGNVAQPAGTPNIARIIALKAGLPVSLPAYTVQRNCGSGTEALTTAADKIIAGRIDIAVVGGTESMSNIPLLFNKRMAQFLGRLNRARTGTSRLRALSTFRPGMLKPIIGVIAGLTDPICGMIMGKTAEVLAREFRISREDQDRFALESHRRALAAKADGRLKDEILPTPVPPGYDRVQVDDDGPRAEQSMAALQRLRPFFDRHNGTVTVGNSCPISDGAAAMLVMKESRARELGLEPLGYLRDYAYAGLEPERMGLGPVYATAKLVQHEKVKISEIDVIELNEAFAAQVLANLTAFASDDFATTYLGMARCVGEIDPLLLNVNGGAIALGHPVGMTGARLVLTVLKELRRRNKNLGLATMCIGGGQGGAVLLEAA